MAQESPTDAAGEGNAVSAAPMLSNKMLVYSRVKDPVPLTVLKEGGRMMGFKWE